MRPLISSRLACEGLPTMRGAAPVAFASAAVSIAPRLKIGPSAPHTPTRSSRSSSGAPAMTARAARSITPKSTLSPCATKTAPACGPSPLAEDVDALGRHALARDLRREDLHRHARVVRPQVGDRAARGRHDLLTGDVEADLAQLLGDRAGRHVAGVRADDDRPAARADRGEHFAGAVDDDEPLAGALDERSSRSKITRGRPR